MQNLLLDFRKELLVSSMLFGMGVYIGDDYKRQNRLERMTRQLENEHNRAEKLQRKMERIYIEEFAEE